VGALIGRLPIAALSLSTIILIRHETGSFAIAGVVEASVGIAAAVSLPVQGGWSTATGRPPCSCRPPP